MKNQTIDNFLTQLASSSPTPGGGGAASLCASMGASLLSMVCNLTIGKPKYAENEDEVKTIRNLALDLKERFLQLSKDDEVAFEPLSKLVVKLSRNVQQLMGWCGVLCLAGNAALADEAAQIATISPMVRSIVENHVECKDEEDAYRLRVRLATFTSGMGVYGSQLVPWHCFPVFFAGIAGAVYPLCDFTPMDIIGHNYLSFIMVGAILLLTFTGLDRFLPMFALPGKDRVRLRK